MSELSMRQVISIVRQFVGKSLKLRSDFNVYLDSFESEGKKIDQSFFLLDSVSELKIKGYPSAHTVNMRGSFQISSPQKACVVVCDKSGNELLKITGDTYVNLGNNLKLYFVRAGSWVAVVERMVFDLDALFEDKGDDGAEQLRALLLSMAREILKMLQQKQPAGK